MAFTPIYPPSSRSAESSASNELISSLKLQSHPEGGYFVETDRSSQTVPNPFKDGTTDTTEIRKSSTMIHYLLTPYSPQGHFHRNKGRTMHLHHRGKARYIILHADEWDGKTGSCRLETYIVGDNYSKGEKLQWLVEGGKYKASYLVDAGEGEGNDRGEGCLISEVVVPGFEYTDHDFLTYERLVQLVGMERAEELKWLVRKE